MRMLGLTAKRILIGGLLLSLGATVLLMVQGNDAFLEALIAVGGFGLLLTALPAVLLLFYGRRQPPPRLPRDARVAVWFSAIALVLLGALLVAVGADLESSLDQGIGIAAGLLGIVTVVALMRFTAPEGGETRLPSGSSSAVGAVLCFVVTVALPKFACGCGTKPYRAVMQSDLRNLVTAEEAFFSDHHRYASGEELQRDTAFFPSRGDSIVVVPQDSAGWRALASHELLVNVRCGVWVGVRPPDGMHGARQGTPVCWREP